MQMRTSVAAHTNNTYPIADPRNLVRGEFILGTQQKFLKRSTSIVDIPTKLGLQERIELLPELGRGEDCVLGGLLGSVVGLDGKRVEVEGNLRVGRRVGRVRGQWEALPCEQGGRLTGRSCGGEDDSGDVGEPALVRWVSARRPPRCVRLSRGRGRET
jgi:hypothetical protein